MKFKAFECTIVTPIFKKYGTFNFDCIDSLLNQTYEGSYEIILVGNNDDIEYVKDYYKNEKRLVFCLCNIPSPGALRNAGLKKSSGDHIMFVDCDDIISKDFLLVASKYWDDCDLLMIGHTREISEFNKKQYIKKPISLEQEDLKKEVYSRYSSNKSVHQYSLLFDSVWAKVFSRSIIINNNVTFYDELVRAEDALFVNNYLLFTNKLIALPSYHAYYWRKNPSSQMYNNMHFYTSTFIFVEELYKILDNLPNVYKDGLSDYCGALSTGCLQNIFTRTNGLLRIRKLINNAFPHKTKFYKDTILFLKKKKGKRNHLLYLLFKSHFVLLLVLLVKKKVLRIN